LPEKESFKYFIQVTAAVQFLHSIGLAHRDIKPENILLDEDRNVKLCDFGWCVDVSKGERMTFCGTYEYMAPEIVDEKYYDYSIDVWSLGVLLYEMIHGFSPFRPNKKNSKIL
jgi:serine/threonine protein kinase